MHHSREAMERYVLATINEQSGFYTTEQMINRVAAEFQEPRESAQEAVWDVLGNKRVGLDTRFRLARLGNLTR